MMKSIKIILLLFFVTSFYNTVFAQNNYSAKKLYREFSKYEQFKQAKIPKFVIAAARMFIKNDDINSVLKAVQKSRVISVNNPKYNERTSEIFSDFSSKLDPTKYKAEATSIKKTK